MNIKNSMILALIAGVAVAAIGFLVFSYGESNTMIYGLITKDEVSKEDGEDNPEEINPKSLQAIANKKFDGRDLVLGQILNSNENYTRRYITYKSGELTISGVMNVPKGNGPFPVLILNHGYVDPAVYTNGRGLKREQDYLARQGFAVLHPDYRNHAQSDKVPDVELNFRLGYTEDVINAILAVRESSLPFLDKENIGILGHSLGGGIALNIMVTKPGLIGAYVLFAPVSADYRDNFKKWIERRQEIAEAIIERHGTPESNPKFWDGLSPVNFLDNVAEPVMIHHGIGDESVPIEWSDKLVSKLNNLGKNATYHIYPDEPHEFAAAWSLVMQRTTEFFNQHLKN